VSKENDRKGEVYTATAGGRATAAAIPGDGLSFLLTMLTLGVWRFFCVPQAANDKQRAARGTRHDIFSCFFSVHRRPHQLLQLQ